MSKATEKKYVNIAVLTVSDTRTMDTDTSGALLDKRIRDAGHQLIDRKIVPDNIQSIRDTVSGWISDANVDVIISTGGTGLTGRDITPEAIRPLFDKELDGFSVVFHQVSFESIGVSTLQSRAFAGIADGIFIFCLPGSNGAVKDGWDKIIRFELDSTHKPCNLVEIMPRLCE